MKLPRLPARAALGPCHYDIPCAAVPQAPQIITNVRDGFAIQSRSTLGHRYSPALGCLRSNNAVSAEYDIAVGAYDVCTRLELNRGGMATIHPARHRPTGSLLLAKVSGLAQGANERARQALLREARALQRIHHPHVVRVHETLQWGDAIALVMDDVGQSVINLCYFYQITSVPLELVLEIGIQAAAALSAAHAAGVVHGDVKPSNILARKGGDGIHVTLVDFGVCTMAGESDAWRRGRPTGTAQFASPEQALGAAIDPRSDLYSLGVTLHVLLEAEYPFWDTHDTEVFTQQVHAPKPPLSRERASFHVRANAIVDQLTRKDPAERYQSADDLRRDLRALQDCLDRRNPAVAATPNWTSCASPMAMACRSMAAGRASY